MRTRWMLVLIVLAGCDSAPDAVLPVEPDEAVRPACVLPEQDIYTGAVEMRLSHSTIPHRLLLNP